MHKEPSTPPETLPGLSDILAPLLAEHGYRTSITTRTTSSRPCKHKMKLVAWTHPYDLQIFVYEDATVGLRDSNVSNQVHIDIDMAKPGSIAQLESWMKEMNVKYVNF